MKKALLLSSLLILAIPAAYAQDSIEQCYKAATNEVAMRECLKKELQQTRDEYREALDKLTQQAGELDRVTGRNEAMPALEKANMSFDRYVSEQCRFEETMFSGGAGGGGGEMGGEKHHDANRSGGVEASRDAH